MTKKVYGIKLKCKLSDTSEYIGYHDTVYESKNQASDILINLLTLSQENKDILSYKADIIEFNLERENNND